MASEKSIVEAIYNEKAKNDSNSRDLANSLNILANTVFGSINRFVFELLQNADDAPATSSHADLIVEFRLFNNYLLFSHNGEHFNEDDVKGISSVGSGQSKKDKNREKTGYKGIGFKSVFGTSDEVTIVSNHFSFRFDKTYPLWKDNLTYPWQVIPIWTEEIPEEVRQHVNPKLVNTIIRIPNRVTIKSEIENVFNDSQVILFLRNIHSVSFFDFQKQLFKIEKRQLNNGIRELYKNEKLLSSWIIKDFIVPIESSVSASLLLLSKEVCPDKLKTATQTKITFAGCVLKDQLQRLDNTTLYSYLPTDVDKGFPYLINADFILNAERTQLLANAWNDFLFREIGFLQFKWIENLNTTPLKFQVLKLIRKRTTYIVSDLDKNFNSGFEKGVSQVAFVPAQDGSKLLKIEEAVVDTTGFSDVFGTALVSKYLNGKQVSNSLLEGKDIIIQCGATEFEIETLCKLLQSQLFIDNKGLHPETNIRVVQFLFQITSSNRSQGWIEYLKLTPFLLDKEQRLKTPKEIFYPPESMGSPIEFSDGLDFINESTYGYFKNQNGILEWLSDLGVRAPSEEEIVRKVIFPMIDKGQIDASNTIDIVRFVFKIFKAGKFTDNDYSNLRKMKVLTNKGLQFPEKCYLPNELGPELKIEQVISNAFFVSTAYVEDKKDELKWKEFFVEKLSVRQKLEIRVLSDRMERLDFKRAYPQYAEYFTFLDENNHYSPVTKSYREGYGQHGVLNFVFIEFIEYTNNYVFAKIFWKQILSNWNTVIDAYSKMRYYHRQGTENVPSYLKYFVKSFHCIPATDGNCYKSGDVYIPSLNNLIGDHFPVANFEGSINKEQAEYLGLKRHVTFLDCLYILDMVKSKQINSELNKQVVAVYEQIIKSENDLTEQDFESLNEWRRTAKLLTENQTFKELNSLYCFAVKGRSAPVNSEYFLKVPFDFKHEETIRLCDIFGVPVITFEKLKFVAEGDSPETSLKEVLTSIVRFIAVLFAHQSSEKEEKVAGRLLRRIESTSFYNAKKLSLIYEDGENRVYDAEINAWFAQNSVYFVGAWRSPLTMYELCNTLCAYLDIKGIEMELGLILQLNEREIHTWLTNRGYNLVDLIPAIEEESPSIVEEPVIPVEESISTTIEVEAFTPQVAPSEIDMSNVQVQQRVISPRAEGISSAVELNTQAKIDVGRWCEEFVFHYLKNRFGDAVTWENEIKEARKPFDFTVSENGITKYIEVKGTPSQSKQIISLSLNEWKLMFEKEANYSIYRVFNAGKSNARIEFINNPSEKIPTGEIMPVTIDLQI